MTQGAVAGQARLGKVVQVGQHQTQEGHKGEHCQQCLGTEDVCLGDVIPGASRLGGDPEAWALLTNSCPGKVGGCGG